ncbi:MAG: GIY-YIG nuclease family protein [Armatimonadota bacterium]
MTQAQTVSWLSHVFTVYSQGGQWNSVAGIYIFAGLNPQGRWVPLYIGKTDSFQNRIPSHEQWAKAKSLGATHVHAMTVLQAATRDQVEQALIQYYKPRLNDQLK